MKIENRDLKINTMLNPLSFFKKKTTQPSDLEGLTPQPVVEQPIQIDNIVIHTMPERFRHASVNNQSAKTTGMIIIGGGVVFLLLASALLYFYLFKQPAVSVNQEQPVAEVSQPDTTEEVQPEINQGSDDAETSTLTDIEPPILPTDDGLATSTATSTQEIIEQELPIGLIPSLDSDLDGLSDAEEILLATSTSTPDTDGDSYPDGAELLNLYDPASTAKLIDNPNIALYQNQTFNYSLLYLKDWQMSVNGGDDSIMFQSGDNQFLQIIVQANPTQQPLDQWYMDQLAVTEINEADRLSAPDWQGIKNLDGLTLYLMDLNQDYVFTLAYNPGENNILDYIDIFNMMIKSFTLSNSASL